MVDIEDSRGLMFRSWKKYAEFLRMEVMKLQQFLDPEHVRMAFEGAKRDFGYEEYIEE